LVPETIDISFAAGGDVVLCKVSAWGHACPCACPFVTQSPGCCR
jgi:hypothetical protein